MEFILKIKFFHTGCFLYEKSAIRNLKLVELAYAQTYKFLTVSSIDFSKSI